MPNFYNIRFKRRDLTRATFCSTDCFFTLGFFTDFWRLSIYLSHLFQASNRSVNFFLPVWASNIILLKWINRFSNFESVISRAKTICRNHGKDFLREFRISPSSFLIQIKRGIWIETRCPDNFFRALKELWKVRWFFLQLYQIFLRIRLGSFRKHFSAEKSVYYEICEKFGTFSPS